MSGFYLKSCSDMSVGESKVYGDRYTKIDKIMRTYSKSDRSLGVLLSGDKGQGKSLFLRMLAERFLSEGIPVVRVSRDYDDIVSFLDSLDECAIVFDEFDKTFRNGSGISREKDKQSQFLSLFDGVSQKKKLYCVTINGLGSASEFMFNRPGRFHYHIRFEYPTPGEIGIYMRDQVPGITDSEVDDVVTLGLRTNLNYDHLRAIAAEMVNNPEDSFAQLVADLNIKNVHAPDYDVVVVLSDGSKEVGGIADAVNFLRPDVKVFRVYFDDEDEEEIEMDFFASDVITVPGGGLRINGSAMRMRGEIHDDLHVDHVEITLRGQTKISYF